MPAPSEPTPDLTAIAADPARFDRLAELRKKLATQRRRNWQYAARQALIAAMILGVITALRWLFDTFVPDLGGWKQTLSTPVFVLLILPWCAFLVTLTLPENSDWTRYQLKLHEAESDQIRAAAAVIASARPFLLYLRSFDAEVAGLREVDDKSRTVGEMAHQAQMMSGGVASLSVESVPPELFDLTGAWSVQNDILGRLAARREVVLLGNSRLDRSLASQVSTGTISEIMMVSEDWWQVFRALAQHAEAVVVSVEVATPSLERELDHLMRSSAKALVVAKRPELGLHESALRPDLLLIGFGPPPI